MSRRHVDPLSAVYADALGQVADERGGEALLREVGEALAALGAAWVGDRDLRAFFLSAMVKEDAKEAALAKLIAPLPPVLADLIRLLARRGRGALLGMVAVAFEAWLDRRLGRVPVTLATATEAAPEHVRAWADRLRAALGQEPVVEHVVRPELVAGATIRVGDRVLDGSARRMLAEFGQRVRERGKHAVQA